MSTTERCAALTRNEIQGQLEGGEDGEEDGEPAPEAPALLAPISIESPGIILLIEEEGAEEVEVDSVPGAEDEEGDGENAAAFLPSTQTALPTATSSNPPLGVGVLLLEAGEVPSRE